MKTMLQTQLNILQNGVKLVPSGHLTKFPLVQGIKADIK
jgi:hypothetical protein